MSLSVAGFLFFLSVYVFRHALFEKIFVFFAEKGIKTLDIPKLPVYIACSYKLKGLENWANRQQIVNF